jgi:hypothetical protein
MYVHALGLVQQGWGAPQEKSESDRIWILHLILTLHSDAKQPSKMQAALGNLFKAQMKLLQDDERARGSRARAVIDVEFEVTDNACLCIDPQSGRCFAALHEDSGGKDLWKMVEMPRGTTTMTAFR